MDMPPIVSPQDWETARQELLVKEKELTRARDALVAQRRRMPRMAVEQDYRFEGPDVRCVGLAAPFAEHVRAPDTAPTSDEIATCGFPTI